MVARLALIVSTYERPDALAAVLGSLAHQSAAPDELIVADDGSEPATRAVVERYAAAAHHPVEHVWHRHEGFRLCRIRNLAIAHTRADYLVQLDGDMVLHRDFIADHRSAARRGTFVQGTRILADPTLSATLLANPRQTVGATSSGLGGLRRLYALHLPRVSARSRVLANAFIAIKGCNQGFWRADLERVNGYDEDMTGWGSEDKELAARLQNSGIRRRTLLFGGIAFHLHHAPASRERSAINQSFLARTRRERLVRCERGLDQPRA